MRERRKMGEGKPSEEWQKALADAQEQGSRPRLEAVTISRKRLIRRAVDVISNPLERWGILKGSVKTLNNQTVDPIESLSEEPEVASDHHPESLTLTRLNQMHKDTLLSSRRQETVLHIPVENGKLDVTMLMVDPNQGATRIGEIDKGIGRKQFVLKFLIGAQQKIFDVREKLLGYESIRQTEKITNTVSTYKRLLIESGVDLDLIDTAVSNDTFSLNPNFQKEKIEKKVEGIVKILKGPQLELERLRRFNEADLQFFFEEHVLFSSKTVKELGFPDLLLEMNDDELIAVFEEATNFAKEFVDPESDRPNSKPAKVSPERFLQAIKKARLMAASLYGESYWRGFTEKLMNASKPENMRAGRFVAMEGREDLNDRELLGFISEFIRPAVEKAQESGVSYLHRQVSIANGQGEATLEHIPVRIPLHFYYSEEGKVTPSSEPVVDVYYKDKPYLDQKERQKRNDDHDRANKTTCKVQIIKIDQQQEALNLQEFSQLESVRKAIVEAKQSLDAPMQLLVFRHGRQTFFIAISDHNATDGGPLNDNFLGEIMRQFDETYKNRPKTKKGNEEKFEAPKDLDTFEQVLLTLPIKDSLYGFRQWVKDKHKQGMLIQDHDVDRSDKPLNTDLGTESLSLGTLMTLMIAPKIQEVAREFGLKADSLGGLAASDFLDEQLRMINFTGLELPQRLSELVKINDQGHLQLSKELSTSVATFKDAVGYKILKRDPTKSIVEQVSHLPRILWGLNAYFTTKTPLSRIADSQTGHITISSLNSDKVGGPALVPEWTDVAVTMSGFDKEEGNLVIAVKTKLEGEQAKAFYERLNEVLVEFNEVFRQDLNVLKEEKRLKKAS